MGALDHDDLVHRRAREPREDAGQQQALLGRAEARCLSRGEHHRRDRRAHGLSSTVTLRTRTVRVGRWVSGSPKVPILSTASRPSATRPTTA